MDFISFEPVSCEADWSPTNIEKKADLDREIVNGNFYEVDQYSSFKLFLNFRKENPSYSFIYYFLNETFHTS